MSKINKFSLKHLQSNIKKQYSVDINEENYEEIILKELGETVSLKKYLKDYIAENKNINLLEWACLIYLFSQAVKDRNVPNTEKYYKKLKKYPDNYFTETVMGDLYLRYYGDLFKSKDMFLKGLKLKQNDANCYYNLGLIYYLLGMFSRSVEFYDYAATNCDNAVEPKQIKGRSLYNMAIYNINVTKEYEEAKKLLEEALKEMPDYSQAKNTLEELKGAL